MGQSVRRQAGFQQLVREQEAQQPHTSEQGSHRRMVLFHLTVTQSFSSVVGYPPPCLSVWDAQGLFGAGPTRKRCWVALGREEGSCDAAEVK